MLMCVAHFSFDLPVQLDSTRGTATVLESLNLAREMCTFHSSAFGL